MDPSSSYGASWVQQVLQVCSNPPVPSLPNPPTQKETQNYQITLTPSSQQLQRLLIVNSNSKEFLASKEFNASKPAL